MLSKNLSYSSLPQQLAQATVSGTTTIDTAAVDLASNGNAFQSVIFFLKLGTAAANNKVIPMGSSDGGATYSQLKDVQIEIANTFDVSSPASTAIEVVPDSDGQIVVVDLKDAGGAGGKVRLQIQRGTATTVSEVWAVLYDASTMPTTGGLTSHFTKTYQSAHT